MPNTTRESKTILTAEDRASAVFDKFSDSINGANTSSLDLQSSLSKLGEGVEERFRAMTESMINAAKNAYAAVSDVYQKIEQRSTFAAKAIGVSVALLLTGTLVGAVYTAYKAIKEVSGFVVGLFSGDSYKNQYALALLEATKQNEKLAEAIGVTSASASAINETFAAAGESVDVYANMMQASQRSIRENSAELDRLGIIYIKSNNATEDAANLIDQANKKLNEYTEGYDRNAAAAAIGLGAAKDVATAAALQKKGFGEAAATLQEYSLMLGPLQTERAKEFETATRAFEHNADLTAQGFKRAIGDTVLPLLSDLADFFKDGFPTAVAVFRYTLAGLTTLIQGFAMGIYTLTEPILAIFETAATSAVTLGKAVYAGITGNFVEAQQILEKGRAEIGKRWSDVWDGIAARSDRTWNNIVLAWGQDDKGPVGSAMKTGKAWEAAGKATEEALDSTKISAYLAELAALESALAKLRGQGELEAYVLKLQEDRFNDLTKAQRENLIGKEKTLLLEKQEIETRKLLLEADVAYINAMEQMKNQLFDYKSGLNENLQQLAFEGTLIGKTASEITRMTDARQADLTLRRAIAALPKDASSQDIQRYIDATDKIKGQTQALRENNAVLTETVGIQDKIAGGFGQFFSDLVTKGRGAFDALKQSMKSFFAELLAALAKRYILNIITGGAGGYGQVLSTALGGGVGGGGGGLSSVFSSGSSVSSAYSSLSGGGLGAASTGLTAVGGIAAGALIGYGVGAAVSKNPNNSGSTGGAVGGAAGAAAGAYFGSALGPIGTVVGAIVGGLIGAFSADRGRPKVEGGYIGQYDASGKEVRNQFERVYTSNALDDTFKPVAQTFADRYIELIGKLGGKGSGFTFSQGVDTDPGGTAQNRISTRLLGANGQTIFNSRDREIGRDNKDIDKNIALDVARAMLAGLQQADLPKQVHDILMGGNALTGTVEDIDKFVAAALEMQGVLTALSTTTIKGLTIDTLQQFQAQGESIGQTYARINSAFDALNGVFVSGDDKIRNTQATLQTIFDSMGVQLPNSVEGFKALIASIDVSTESGRGLFNMLAQTAPAFKAVQDAVAQMIDSFNQSVGTIAGPEYQRALISNQLNGVVDQWIRLTNSTFTRQQTIDYIRTAAQNPDATLAYAAQFGPEGTRLISEMFRLFASLQTIGGGTGAGSPINTVTAQLAQLAQAAAQLAQQFQAAKDGLNTYLQGSKVSALSPLTVQQKYDEARAQLNAQIAKAQGGDVSAFSSLGNLRDVFLGFSRELNGSGGAYNNDFLSTFDKLNMLGGNQVDRPYSAADSRTQTSAIVNQLRENNAQQEMTTNAILGLINLIANGVETSDPRMIELTEEIKRNTKAGTGSLTSSTTI